MIRSTSLSLLVSLATILVSPALVSADSDTCADRSVSAGAVRTQDDVRAFVQCAYELVQEVGAEEARRAFNEDERWKSGSTYIFVDEVTPMTDMARAFVFPPDPSREGEPWGLLIDAFGNDYYKELTRVMGHSDEGWLYYSFTNPATGRDEPKASYVKALDWNGTPAAVGAGVYRRDMPGTCWREEVSAMSLEEDPSPRKAAGVCPLRRHGTGFNGVFRHCQPGQGFPLAQRLDLPVRPGYVRLFPLYRFARKPLARLRVVLRSHRYFRGAKRAGSCRCLR